MSVSSVVGVLYIPAMAAGYVDWEVAVVAVCHGCGGEFPRRSKMGREPKWCSERCRKRALYAGTCATCGALTNGYDGPGTASDECGRCRRARQHRERRWTPETVVAAIRRWVEVYGSVPGAADWNPAMARTKRSDVEAWLRRWEAGDWPNTITVQRECGSWADAVEAAGFKRPRPGYYGRPGEDPNCELVQDALRRYAEGETCQEIAASLGMSPQGVWGWLRRAGVERRPAMRRQLEAA